MMQAQTRSGLGPRGIMALLRLFVAALLIVTGSVWSLGASGLVGFSPAFAQEEDDDDFEDDDDSEEDNGDFEDEGDEAGDSDVVDHSNIVVDSSLWILDFNLDRVGSITMLEGPFKGQIFWCMTYSVENKSATERNAYISITAESDRRKRYADIYLGDVERAVERKVGRPLWGKTDVNAARKDLDPTDAAYHYNEFKPGEKRDCVAIFGELDPSTNNIKIIVRGLSNDYHLVETEDGDREIEERVYEIFFHRPGDEYAINLDRFIQKKKGWAKKRTKLVIPTGKDDEDADG